MNPIHIIIFMAGLTLASAVVLFGSGIAVRLIADNVSRRRSLRRVWKNPNRK